MQAMIGLAQPWNNSEMVYGNLYISSANNIVADALSRVLLSTAVSLGINIADIASAQCDCPELASLHDSSSIPDRLSLQECHLSDEGPVA